MPTVRKTNVLLTRDYTWKFKGKSSEDTATSVLRYKDDFDGWATRCPLYGEVHPDLPAFKLIEIEADREPGDQIAVTLTYEANSFSAEYPGRPGSSEATPRYSVSITSVDEHILSSDYAVDAELSRKELDALQAISSGTMEKSDGSKYSLDITSDVATSLLAKIDKGNVDVKSNSLIYTETKLTDTLADLEFSNINKRERPPGDVPGGADNWLYIGANADPSTDGEAWTITREWQYSPNGWDEDLYPLA